MNHFHPDPSRKILDIGFAEKEYSPVDNFIEKTYPYPNMLTALGIESTKSFRKRYPKVKAVQYNGDVFPFANKEFDICWSNAVIEHVGDEDKQITFIKKIMRVGRHALYYYAQQVFPDRTPHANSLASLFPENYVRFLHAFHV
jgi:SAM-dependent methyltransferase